MTLTELRYIVALARERHFGRAAQRCHVAQPTLSVAVKKLESTLGVMLFERGQHDVRPTSAGEAIVQQAEQVIAQVLCLTELAARYGDPLSGPLRLGAIYTIGPYLLPRLVPLIKARAPQMPLMIEEGYTDGLLDALKNGDLDVIVLALPIDQPGIVTQPVYEEQFCVLMPATHPWRSHPCIKASDLAHSPLLMLGRGNCFRDQVLDLCEKAGAGGPQVLEGSSLETIRYMVASGIGPTVMPASAVAHIAENDPLLCVKPFDHPQPIRQVALAWRASFPRFAAIDALRSAILDSDLSGCRPITSRRAAC
jgi:LysR family hydrogen peroxide-inducible transcriptional activator